MANNGQYYFTFDLCLIIYSSIGIFIHSFMRVFLYKLKVGTFSYNDTSLCNTLAMIIEESL